MNTDALSAKPASACDGGAESEQRQRPWLRDGAGSVDGDIIQAVGVVVTRIPIEKVDGGRRRGGRE